MLAYLRGLQALDLDYMKRPLCVLLIVILGIFLILPSCRSPFGSSDLADSTSVTGSWKMTPETSTLAVGLIRKDHPILFSFDLKPDSSAILYFVNSNGKITKTGTWSRKAPSTSLSKNARIEQSTDLLIYYADSTNVIAIGYQLENEDNRTELISLQKEHYQQGL